VWSGDGENTDAAAPGIYLIRLVTNHDTNVIRVQKI